MAPPSAPPSGSDSRMTTRREIPSPPPVNSATERNGSPGPAALREMLNKLDNTVDKVDKDRKRTREEMMAEIQRLNQAMQERSMQFEEEKRRASLQLEEEKKRAKAQLEEERKRSKQIEDKLREYDSLIAEAYQKLQRSEKVMSAW